MRRALRTTLTAVLAAPVLGLLASPGAGADASLAQALLQQHHVMNESAVDQVRVMKHRRKLFLLSGDRIVREYRISLGNNPYGHKRHAGDERTPEGVYQLDWRNPNSRYYRSIHISYPAAADVARAEAAGRDPGGDIMIHGLPSKFSGSPMVFEGRDWTDGCVALNDNTAMDELWALVPDGTPIEILP